MPKVTISEMEYNCLKAAAELTRYPEVLVRTLSAIGRARGESLDEAFEQRAASAEATEAEARPRRSRTA